MTITTNNNKQIWIAMIVLFGLGMVWNSYYAKYLSEGYVSMLEEKNAEANVLIDIAKAQRDSARIERVRLAFQLSELDLKVQKQEGIIDEIKNQYDTDLNHLKDLKDEKEFIPDVSDDSKFEFLSNYAYKEMPK